MTAFRKCIVVMLAGVATLGFAMAADYSLMLQVRSPSMVGDGMPFYVYNH